MNNPKKYRRLALAGLALLCAVACSRDPRATRLPTNLKDIPTVQPQLDKLPADERQLVLAYLKRSKGDVMHPSATDPEAPLTAQNFGEAIKLQREFNAKFPDQQANWDDMKAEREAAVGPMQAALRVEYLRREIMTADQLNGRQPAQDHPLDTKAVLALTFRLVNYAGESISQLEGYANIRSLANPDSPTPLFSCYITRHTPLAASESAEVRCQSMAIKTSQAQEAFMALPESSLLFSWEPRKLRFASGRILEGPQ